MEQRHQLTEKLLRQLSVVEDLRRQLCRRVHGTDHRSDELALQVRAGGELSRRVVLGLLLQGLTFFQAVLDRVADALDRLGG
jgi:hypothetical protein